MEIVLVVCLLTDPGKCKEEHLPDVVQTQNPASCAVASVPHMARWMGDHPAYRLVSWRCTPAGERSL